METHPSIPAWEIPWTEEPMDSPWGHREYSTTWQLNNRWWLLLQIKLHCSLTFRNLVLQHDENYQHSIHIIVYLTCHIHQSTPY